MMRNARGSRWVGRRSVTAIALAAGLLVAGLGAHLAGAEGADDALLPPEMVSLDDKARGLVRTANGLELNGAPYSGRLFERFDDGSLHRSTTYREGILSGDRIEWSPDGRIAVWESLGES